MKRKHSLVIAALLVFTLIFTACGSESKPASGEASASADAGGAKEVKKIIIGTGTQFPGVCFIDENGKLTGFDVELVRELDKRLDGYEFEFKTMDFSNLLLSLETNKIDVIAHQMEKNPEREAKFLFNKEPYSIFLSKVAVSAKNNDVKSIEDLKGKKIQVSPTSNQAYFLKKYKEEHKDAYDLIFSSNGSNDLVQQIESGRIDATLSTDFALRFYTDADGKEALKTVGEPLIQSDVLFVLRKDSQELADQLDEAIREVKADGTLSKLSLQWLGADYTKGLAESK
ncbi:extracellular solute-binding protein family 3 [Paenibacillus curdlanolyticus YK9]|uniref:Extracellular solute-binding protein family 3 n=1 Tax=Paenibacillus curdlanolyticus YK9 TaxID=717606 RepID=E0I7Y4_9BACL|nr:transporter substrate-binding domain-containing protein [Paenibacillus curdlanolyticus]EFM11289.1 extracellular solute-binding protein family 3 [Paenibacillus curdlanolyticus YK9]